MKAFITKILICYFDGGITTYNNYCIAENSEQAIINAKNHVLKLFSNKNGELTILSCEEVKPIKINAKDLIDYIHLLDVTEYKIFLNSHYGLTSTPFKCYVNFEKLNVRHKMYTIATNMILEGDY